MKLADRKKRDRAIVRMFLNKTPQSEIARRVGMARERVHDILVAHGVLDTPKPRDVVTVTIWDLESKDRLRRAIYQRQREGARAALAAMEQS